VNTNTTSALYGANNKTYASYQYYGSEYQSTSWVRSVLGLITGLLALGILVFAVVWAVKRFEDNE
jgi:hypothetical protein